MSWTKEELGKLREHQTSMLTVSEIAEKMQKDKREVRQELVRMGYLPREVRPEPEKSEFTGKTVSIEPRAPMTRVSDEEKAQIVSLRNEGYTYQRIANKLGIKLPTVKTIVQKFNRAHKEDNVKAAQINEDFDRAVNEMIAETKEKEPASATTDTSSVTKEVNSLSQDNDTTETPECQAPALTGIKMMMEIEAMLGEVFGRDAEIIDINANDDHCDIGFTYYGREYSLLFAEREQVPEYGRK